MARSNKPRGFSLGECGRLIGLSFVWDTDVLGPWMRGHTVVVEGFIPPVGGGDDFILVARSRSDRRLFVWLDRSDFLMLGLTRELKMRLYSQGGK